MATTALIIGSSGQDGRLLAEHLRSLGDEVMSLDRSGLTTAAGHDASVSIDHLDRILEMVRRHQPREVYYLAGYHTSSEKRGALDPLDEYRQTQAIHVGGLMNVLEALRVSRCEAKVFYAASSLVFRGGPEPITESTPLSPQGFYGQSKVDGLFAGDEYRRRFGLHFVGGYLFNHESRLRPLHFVTQKVARSAAMIARGKADQLQLGSLDAVIDWSHAADFVRGFVDVLRKGRSENYVFASGQGYSIRELVEVAFAHVGLDWARYVNATSTHVQQKSACRIGDPSKLKADVGWTPRWTFEAMVKDLVAFHLGDETA